MHMSSCLHRIDRNGNCRIGRRSARQVLVIVGALVLGASAHGQELIYQEGFNTDGAGANPPRYTFTGRDKFEVPRIQSELSNFDQKGPIFWGHNFEVSYVGNPTIPARRMIMTWRGADASAATEDLLQLFDSSVDWLLEGKKGATVVVIPNAASIQGLADRLASRGHTVVDDDTAGTPDEQDVVGDLLIHGPGASNPSRFVLSQKPVIVMNAPDYDDMLVGSIGSAVTFTPGKATIAAPGHPAAGGKTGSFDAFTAEQPFEIVGSFLPPGATTLATATRVVPPSISNLGDLDAAIAGTKAHDKSSGTVTELDLSDASAGNWQNDHAVPGGYAGNWGLRIVGKLSVAKAGTYRVGLGSDDGIRFQIDLDKDGMTANDIVLEDPGPHAHQVVYTNVSFASAGTYDFEVRSYNSGGGGGVEVSVSTVEAPVPDDALDSGYWEVLSTAPSLASIRLATEASVTSYVATGQNAEVQTPIIVLLNGPQDTPPGSFYDGGPFTGFEGAGFLAASGINKWAYPSGQTYRSVRLAPVNVTGKTNVHLTVALAATVVDFEDSDLIDIVVYPRGAASAPVTLAHFRGVQNAIQPWLADQRDNYVRRLTRQFADFTYDVPADATELIVEIRVATTWWTEIAAIDNVRITAGTAAAEPVRITSVKADAQNVVLEWTGGAGPFLVQSTINIASGPWTEVVTTSSRNVRLVNLGREGYFRIVDRTTKTVKNFRADLSGTHEVPPVDTPASGRATISIDENTLTYRVVYNSLKAVATAAHIHGPAAAGANASPMFNLSPSPSFGVSGVLSGTQTLTAAQKSSIESGNAYLNIHTSVHGGGEIRGQIAPQP